MSKPVCAVVGIGPKNGAAFVRKFHAAGHAVALMSRKTQFSDELIAELGEDARSYVCDVGHEQDVANAFIEVKRDLGPVDTLIFNAGSGTWGNIEDLDAKAFEQTWRINAMGLFLTSKQVIPSMLERGAGNIVVVGATASLRGKPFTTAFAPAKAAQRSLAQAMARHLGPKGIHVSLMIIDGVINPPDNPKQPETLDPAAIADAAYSLAQQPKSAWTFELDLRPYAENW